MLEDFIEVVAHYAIGTLELIGIFIIGYTALRSFLKYVKEKLTFNDTCIKIELAKGLALGLEFKLGGEILRTILVRTMDDIKILGTIIILRLILTFVIHWEISSELHQEEEIKKFAENRRKNKP
ncbi:DUF1622 domain-containing protein [Natronincola ferrireducens]|uniref:Uncharacterized membrane protein n=1 Tax=Natronincola ferrireducens TaxID=393762 RepID=A0A1G9H2U8_9FIRM|nr:DUF1622 domain-containing protein [Natronincola ferrireducens]SDL07124.1 Uncharacterized membrane protein [Natronincola ferrireducens]